LLSLLARAPRSGSVDALAFRDVYGATPVELTDEMHASGWTLRGLGVAHCGAQALPWEGEMLAVTHAPACGAVQAGLRLCPLSGGAPFELSGARSERSWSGTQLVDLRRGRYLLTLSGGSLVLYTK
jgi:hypothetical protein